MDFTVLWYLHRTNQSVQKFLPTGPSPVLCHKLAKAPDVRFRLSIQPAGCDAHTCGAKVNSKRVDSPTSLMHSYSPFCKKISDCKAKDFPVVRGPTLLSQLGYLTRHRDALHPGSLVSSVNLGDQPVGFTGSDCAD